MHCFAKSPYGLPLSGGEEGALMIVGGSRSRADLEADLRQIDSRIESTTDPLARREYEESRRSLQDRLSKLDAVSTQLDRVEAQLLSLSNEIDSIVTEIIRLQAIGPNDAAQHVSALTKRLREQRDELKRFEREAVAI
jgi:chromosome segregation ATPase